LLHLALEPRSARTLTSLRAREFTGDQLAVPGQDRVRPGHGCAASARTFATQAMTDLAERGSLGIREHQSAFLQDAVFGGQIFVPRQQLSPQKMYRDASGAAMLTGTTDRPISRFSFLTLRDLLPAHELDHRSPLVDPFAGIVSHHSHRVIDHACGGA
jgi:hypothetical protein